MLAIILLFFSVSLISSHVIQPNPPVGGALSAGLSKRVTNNDFALLGITCSSLYGRPQLEDCRGAVKQIEDVLGTGANVVRAFEHDLYEFTAPGRLSLFAGRGAAEYHTPLYWRSGSCIAALFNNESPGASPAAVGSDMSTWRHIWTNAVTLNRACPGQKNMGGSMRRLGQRHGLSIYLFGPGSQFDRILNIKYRCPICDKNSCPAKQGSDLQCSNNRWVTLNPTAPPATPDPQNPFTLPAEPGDVNTNVQQVCGTACRTNADCECGDYQCFQDNSVIARLRKVTMACVFVPLSSLNGKRGTGSSDKYKVDRDTHIGGP